MGRRSFFEIKLDKLCIVTLGIASLCLIARETHMANSSTAASAEIGRRDLFIGGAGAAALAVGLGRTATALAQAGPGPASGSPSSPPSAAPGRVVVERRGAVLMVGLDLAQAQDRLTPPAIIGLGKAYHQLEQDDGLRVAVLHSIGLNFCAGL